jgi:hypothetical protein
MYEVCERWRLLARRMEGGVFFSREVEYALSLSCINTGRYIKMMRMKQSSSLNTMSDVDDRCTRQFSRVPTCR